MVRSRRQAGVKPEGDLLKAARAATSRAGGRPSERVEIGKEISKIIVDNVWSIGTVGVSPALLGVVVKNNKMGNMPDGSQQAARRARRPATPDRRMFYFKS